ncbi:FAD-dependent oxidoreductase [Planctomycetes bacterium CA13]
MNSPTPTESAIVVGAGVIGIASAHYLSNAGMQVTVIDRYRIGAGCSLGNCGYISPSHVLPLTEPEAIGVALKSLLNPNAPFRVKPRLSLHQWKWFWEFTRRCNRRQMLAAGKHLKAILDSSMSEYRSIVAEQKLSCQWKETGLLYVLQSTAGMRAFSHTERFLAEHFGVSSEQIRGGELTDFDTALKPGLAGAYYFPGDASVRPDLLCSSWSNQLKSRGVKFIENCELQNVSKTSGKITGVQTSHGPMTADHYVLATGAKSVLLSKELGCRIPIEPGKGYSVTMARPNRCPQHPMLFPEHKVGVSPFDDGYRLGSMMEFVGFDESIPERRIEQLRRSAKPYLVEPYTPGKQEPWFGWRPMTWDSLPIIGQVPRLSNAFLATGHNMLGLSLATATGKLITEIIQGHPTHIDATAFSPSRF